MTPAPSPRFPLIAILLLLFSLSTAGAPAADIVEEQTLKATTGAFSETQLGSVVAVDGDVAVATEFNRTALFEHTGTRWELSRALHSSPTGAGESRFAASLDIAGDMVAVGIPSLYTADLSDEHGAVRIFRKGAGGWETETDLVPTSFEPDMELGTVVTCNETMVIASAHGGTTNRVFVFEYDGSDWSESQVLTAPIPEAEATFGSGAVLDGDRLVIMCDGGVDAGNARVAFEYGIGPSGWELADTITLPLAGADMLVAKSVALRGDTLALQTDQTLAGETTRALHVFEHNGAGWGVSTDITPPGANDENTSLSKVVVSDTFVAVGWTSSHWTNPLRGRAFVRHRTGAGWSEAIELESPAGENASNFGNTLACDDSRLLVADNTLSVRLGVRLDDFVGGVHVFNVIDGDGASPVLAIDGPTSGLELPWYESVYRPSGMVSDADGSVVAIDWRYLDDDWMSIPASDGPLDVELGPLWASECQIEVRARDDEGRASDIQTIVVTRAERRMNLTARIASPAPETSYNHAMGAALSGNRIAIGDPQAVVPTGLGRVRIMEFDGLDWNESALIIPGVEGETSYDFGSRVALARDRLAVAAYADRERDVASANVDVFEYRDGVWEFDARLVPSERQYNSYFARGMVMQDDTIVVSASLQDNGPDQQHGALYVFEKSEDAWSETQMIRSPEVGPFGREVALDQDLLVSSSPVAPFGDQSHGLVYVYRHGESGWEFEQQIPEVPDIRFNVLGYGLAVHGERIAALHAQSSFYDFGWDESVGILTYVMEEGRWVEEQLIFAPLAPTGLRTRTMSYNFHLDDDRLIFARSASFGQPWLEESLLQFNRHGSEWVFGGERILGGINQPYYYTHYRPILVEGNRVVFGYPRIQALRGEVRPLNGDLDVFELEGFVDSSGLRLQ